MKELLEKFTTYSEILPEPVKKFLQANWKDIQTKMKSWEYTPKGTSPKTARNIILETLKGRGVTYTSKRQGSRIYVLEDLRMRKFSNGAANYWRLCPAWNSYYISSQDVTNILKKMNGEPICTAGGENYINHLQEIIDTLKKGVIIF